MRSSSHASTPSRFPYCTSVTAISGPAPCDAAASMSGMVTARQLTNSNSAEVAERFGTDLAHSLLGRTVPPETECRRMSMPEETDEMNPVALLTPTYGRDLELCTLLCESVDRHVGSFSKHYLLVPDCDLPLFSHFESERRSVLPASKFLPKWLRPLPRIVQRKRRQYWWSLPDQAGQRLARAAIPQDSCDHLAASPAILHPRFRCRVLSGISTCRASNIQIQFRF